MRVADLLSKMANVCTWPNCDIYDRIYLGKSLHLKGMTGRYFCFLTTNSPAAHLDGISKRCFPIFILHPDGLSLGGKVISPKNSAAVSYDISSQSVAFVVYVLL